MKVFSIGDNMTEYRADSRIEALDNFARDNGYSSYSYFVYAHDDFECLENQYRISL